MISCGNDTASEESFDVVFKVLSGFSRKQILRLPLDPPMIKVEQCLRSIRRMPCTRKGVKICGEVRVPRTEMELKTTEKEGVNCGKLVMTILNSSLTHLDT